MSIIIIVYLAALVSLTLGHVVAWNRCPAYAITKHKRDMNTVLGSGWGAAFIGWLLLVL